MRKNLWIYSSNREIMRKFVVRIPYLKAVYAANKPRLVYDDDWRGGTAVGKSGSRIKLDVGRIHSDPFRSRDWTIYGQWIPCNCCKKASRWNIIWLQHQKSSPTASLLASGGWTLWRAPHGARSGVCTPRECGIVVFIFFHIVHEDLYSTGVWNSY